MYYSYIEVEYVATSFSPARTDLALKLLRPSVGFANGISQYLTKYSSLCLKGSVYTLYRLAHTRLLVYLVHCIHILSTVLTAQDTLLTQMCEAQNNWLRQLSCFLVSSPLDISNFSFALFFGISG